MFFFRYHIIFKRIVLGTVAVMFAGGIVGGRIMWSIALSEKSVAYLHGVNSGKLFLGRITYHHHERRDDTNFTKHFTLGPKNICKGMRHHKYRQNLIFVNHVLNYMSKEKV